MGTAAVRVNVTTLLQRKFAECFSLYIITSGYNVFWNVTHSPLFLCNYTRGPVQPGLHGHGFVPGKNGYVFGGDAPFRDA